MPAPAAEIAPPSPIAASFDDDAWEDLLNFIEEKQVIPIVGPELVVVQTDAGPENLYTSDILISALTKLEAREGK